MAPFWIFNLAAINIDDKTMRECLGLTGVVLCVFSLPYGGFWRIQMRKRFNLPADNFFCGKPAVADFTQWPFCCWCSLAQEVRTADFYDIVEDKFCRKQKDENGQPALSPLPREGPSRLSNYHNSSNGKLLLVEEFSAEGLENFMKPPDLSSMQRDELPLRHSVDTQVP
nr:hypothetical protein CFP56_33249 [Quercus suber]